MVKEEEVNPGMRAGSMQILIVIHQEVLTAIYANLIRPVLVLQLAVIHLGLRYSLIN